MPETTKDHLATVRRRLDGKDISGFNIARGEGEQRASLYALLALVSEQQTMNAQLAGIAISLDRIATALQPTPRPAAEPETKRRLWLPRRRTA